MKVEILSSTIQVFNGERFYLCGKYFQHKGKRLHVTVWKYHNGDIPPKYHVHHVDGNRSNNQIENLRLKLNSIHISEHGKSPERNEYQQRHIKDMRELAAEWHASDEGRAWHSLHEKELWEKRREGEPFEYVCDQCGKTFRSFHLYGEDGNRFCSNACKTKHRAKSGVDDIERICAYCGKTFVTNKYSKARCCSRECGVKLRWGK